MIFWQVMSVVLLLIIANLLNEILSELKLAKKDREDARSNGKKEEQ